MLMTSRFARLDTNAVFLSGYNYKASVSYNTFQWLGQSAIASWGRSVTSSAHRSTTQRVFTPREAGERRGRGKERDSGEAGRGGGGAGERQVVKDASARAITGAARTVTSREVVLFKRSKLTCL